MRQLLRKVTEPLGTDEAWLQRYLANHPELLPLRDLEGIDATLRLIGRELLGIDLLFADDRGLLTVVETKLVKNPELKRQVVAQVLHYGATLNKLDVPHLCTAIATTKDSSGTREAPRLYELAEGLASCGLLETTVSESKRSAAEGMLARYILTGKVERVEERSSAERAFLTKLDTMLGYGSFRLAIVSYEAPRELLDLVNYANTVMRQGHQIVVVELSKTDLADGTYFIPHLVGAPGLMHPMYYREERIGIWDEIEFFRVAARQAPQAIPLMREFHELVKVEAELAYGRGETYGTFKCVARLEEQLFTVFDVSTHGRLGLPIGNYPEAVPDSLLEEFRRRLEEVSGLSIRAEQMAPGKFPTFPILKVFKDPKSDLELFSNAIRWFVSELKAR